MNECDDMYILMRVDIRMTKGRTFSTPNFSTRLCFVYLYMYVCRYTKQRRVEKFGVESIRSDNKKVLIIAKLLDIFKNVIIPHGKKWLAVGAIFHSCGANVHFNSSSLLTRD